MSGLEPSKNNLFSYLLFNIKSLIGVSSPLPASKITTFGFKLINVSNSLKNIPDFPYIL